MSTILEAMSFPDEDLQCTCFAIFIDVAFMHYDALEPFMNTLFQVTSQKFRSPQELTRQVTLEAIKSSPERITKLAIEFWSALGVQEEDIQEQQDFAEEMGTESTGLVCRHYLLGEEKNPKNPKKHILYWWIDVDPIRISTTSHSLFA